jgi:hypothetical protein
MNPAQTEPLPPRTSDDMLAEVTRVDRVTGGLEVGALLEAWGFVQGDPIDAGDPPRAVFWFHPEHPALHMTVPIGGPLCRPVVDYASYLIRSLKNP